MRTDSDVPSRDNSRGKQRPPLHKNTVTSRSQQPNEENFAYQNQLEALVAQYEKEIEDLRASNLEQNQDLHTMIQTVNELKDSQEDYKNKLKKKDEEIKEMKQNFSNEMNDQTLKNNLEHESMLSNIDTLTKQIEEVEL